MTAELFQSLFFLLVPAAVLWLCQRIVLLNKLGPIIICYGVGLVMANLPGIPVDADLSNLFVQVTVPLAIVLLLFPTDFMHWVRHAGPAILSFVFCIIAVIISSVSAAWLFSAFTTESAKVAGMMIGLYTGGTPNMSAIGLALDIHNETFILLSSADVVLGGLYLFFLLSVAQLVLGKFLPAFEDSSPAGNSSHKKEMTEKFSMKNLRAYFLPLIVSLFILGAGVGISFLFVQRIAEVAVILSVTTLGIGASFFKGIRSMKGSYPMGEYLLMIFCIAIGSLADVQQLLSASLTFILYVAFVMIFSIGIHLMLAAFFRIDTDTFLITSTAGLYGPAFVPVIAKALNNEKIVVSGLTTGLIGYAVANYLGLAVAYLLQ